MLAEACCTLPEIVSITGHTLRRGPERVACGEGDREIRERASNRFRKTDCKMMTSNQG
jgi:hypothetical protein